MSVESLSLLSLIKWSSKIQCTYKISWYPDKYSSVKSVFIFVTLMVFMIVLKQWTALYIFYILYFFNCDLYYDFHDCSKPMNCALYSLYIVFFFKRVVWNSADDRWYHSETMWATRRRFLYLQADLNTHSWFCELNGFFVCLPSDVISVPYTSTGEGGWVICPHMSTRGKGGQKRVRICPRGLWTASYFAIVSHA